MKDMNEDWVECNLGDLLKLKNGFAFKSSMYSPEGIPVLRIGDIQDWNVNVENANRIKEDIDYDFHIVNKGDILIAMSGATTGKFGIYNSDEKAYQNQRVGNLIPHSNKFTNKKYIYFLLYSLKYEIEKGAYGGAQPNISASKIEALTTKLFPLPIQRAIVRKIEELFSSLDSGIADLKKAQEQLVIYRQAVLKKAFEGDYEKVKLEDVSTAMGGFAFKSTSFIKESGKYQVVRIGNVRPGLIRYDASPVYLNDVETKVLQNYLLKKGDVIITLTGTRKKRDYGFTTVIKDENLLLNQRLAFLRFNPDFSPKFFLYYSWSEPFKVQFFGSETGNVGQGNVGMKSVRQTLVPVISLQEQKKIVQEIESRLSVCDKVEESITESLEKAKALRQSILKKAFEGKLLSAAEIARCKEDQDYEPAGVLLERIKKEKK
mgnify:CR=1 FL=1